MPAIKRKTATAKTADAKTADAKTADAKTADATNGAINKETENAMTDQNTDQTETPTEGSETTDNPWQYTWNVTASVGDVSHVIAVTRSAKGSYAASIDGKDDTDGKTAEQAVKRMAKALGLKVADTVLDGLDDEAAKPDATNGSNEAPVWVGDEQMQAIADGISASETALTASEIGVREGWLGLGNHVLAARARLTTLSQTDNLNTKLFGAWVKAQQEEGGAFHAHPRLNNDRTAKNTFAEAAVMASAPVAVIGMLPSDINSPKGFQKWFSAHRNMIAAAAVEKALKSDRYEAESENPEGLAWLLLDYAFSHRDLMAADYAKKEAIAAGKAAAENADPDRKRDYKAADFMPAGIARGNEAVHVFDWFAVEDGLAVAVAASDDGLAKAHVAKNPDVNLDQFKASRIGRALLKEHEAKTTAKTASDDDAGSGGSDEVGGSVAPRGFADFTIEEAAMHIVTLLRAREDDDDRNEVLNAVEAILLNASDDAADATDKAEDDA